MADERLIVDIISTKDYRKLQKQNKVNTNDAYTQHAKGDSAWKALQNIKFDDGTVVFSQKDIGKILANVKSPQDNGQIDLTDSIIKAGYGAKLAKLKQQDQGLNIDKGGNIFAQQQQAVPTNPYAQLEPANITEATTETKKTTYKNIISQLSFTDNKLNNLFVASVAAIENGTKLTIKIGKKRFTGTKEDILEKLAENGNISKQEQINFIGAAKNAAIKSAKKDAGKKPENGTNSAEDKKAYEAMADVGFYFSTEKGKNTVSARVNSDESCAKATMRRMLKDLTNSELKNLIRKTNDSTISISEKAETKEITKVSEPKVQQSPAVDIVENKETKVNETKEEKPVQQTPSSETKEITPKPTVQEIKANKIDEQLKFGDNKLNNLFVASFKAIDEGTKLTISLNGEKIKKTKNEILEMITKDGAIDKQSQVAFIEAARNAAQKTADADYSQRPESGKNSPEAKEIYNQMANVGFYYGTSEKSQRGKANVDAKIENGSRDAKATARRLLRTLKNDELDKIAKKAGDCEIKIQPTQLETKTEQPVNNTTSNEAHVQVENKQEQNSMGVPNPNIDLDKAQKDLLKRFDTNEQITDNTPVQEKEKPAEKAADTIPEPIVEIKNEEPKTTKAEEKTPQNIEQTTNNQQIKAEAKEEAPKEATAEPIAENESTQAEPKAETVEPQTNTEAKQENTDVKTEEAPAQQQINTVNIETDEEKQKIIDNITNNEIKEVLGIYSMASLDVKKINNVIKIQPKGYGNVYEINENGTIKSYTSYTPENYTLHNQDGSRETHQKDIDGTIQAILYNDKNEKVKITTTKEGAEPVVKELITSLEEKQQIINNIQNPQLKEQFKDIDFKLMEIGKTGDKISFGQYPTYEINPQDGTVKSYFREADKNSSFKIYNPNGTREDHSFAENGTREITVYNENNQQIKYSKFEEGKEPVVIESITSLEEKQGIVNNIQNKQINDTLAQANVNQLNITKSGDVITVKHFSTTYEINPDGTIKQPFNNGWFVIYNPNNTSEEHKQKTDGSTQIVLRNELRQAIKNTVVTKENGQTIKDNTEYANGIVTQKYTEYYDEQNNLIKTYNTTKNETSEPIKTETLLVQIKENQEGAKGFSLVANEGDKIVYTGNEKGNEYTLVKADGSTFKVKEENGYTVVENGNNYARYNANGEGVEILDGELYRNGSVVAGGNNFIAQLNKNPELKNWLDKPANEIVLNLISSNNGQSINPNIDYEALELVKYLAEDIDFGANRNEDGLSNATGCNAKTINAIYTELQNGINNDDNRLVLSALSALKTISDQGYPITPKALSEKELNSYKAKEQLISMLNGNATADEIKNFIKEQKEAGLDLTITSARDPEKDVVVCPLTNIKNEKQPRTIYNAQYVNELYKNGDYTTLVELRDDGFPISPKPLTAEEIKNYATKYQRGIDVQKTGEALSNLATNIAYGFKEATVEQGGFAGIGGEIKDPNAKTFLKYIYKISDKLSLDVANQILESRTGNANSIEYYASKLPTRARNEVYRHLSQMDPYFQKKYNQMQGNSSILYDLDSNGNVTRKRVVANDGTIKYEQYDASTKKTTSWKDTAYSEAKDAIADASSTTEQGIMIAQYLQKHPSDARFEAAMSMLNSKNISVVECVLNKPIEQWAQFNPNMNKDIQTDLHRKIAIIRKAQNATRNLANLDIENATAEEFKKAISGLTRTELGYVEEYLGTPINLYLAQRGWSEYDKNIIQRQFAMK